MIPSALVSQLEKGTGDFLRASFWSGTQGFESAVDRWLKEDGGIFQGPFVSVKLPFLNGRGQEAFFPKLPLDFPPYAHQFKAFQRLSSSPPKHTIVATGTGSGKTESFLVPILNHCAENVGKKGIKAILIYPMNALASDQALRLAKLIYKYPALRGKVNAGLYVGGENKTPRATMSPTEVITDRAVMREDPPDILLTNYKMLDYLLNRPEDRKLWAYNEPETLRFLAVDELHTFDGAQGTDLACLIRRLKARLGANDASLCCVGTSATLGSDEGSVRELCEYASDVFGAEIGPDSVLGEEREGVTDFFRTKVFENLDVPGRDDMLQMDPATFHTEDAYIKAQYHLWFWCRLNLQHDGSERGKKRVLLERVRMGRRLRVHYYLREILDSLNGETLSLDELVARVAKRSSLIRGEFDLELERFRVLSFLSLISKARRMVQGGGVIPFLQVQVQFWVREMRKIVASVEEEPRFRFYDDLTSENRDIHLPVVHCRECGSMAWATMVQRDKPSDLHIRNLKEFYAGYFRSGGPDPRVHLIYPDPTRKPGTNSDGIEGIRRSLFKEMLTCESLGEFEEPEPGSMAVKLVQMAKKEGGSLKGHRICPVCASRGSMALVGFRAATLTSSFVGQLFASRFNDDKKLLTFSDSVQDAAHRAGFFGARTWRFNLRVAIQKVLENTEGEVSLDELPARFVEWWGARLEPREFVATFIAPDMMWLRDYERLVLGKGVTSPRAFTTRAELYRQVCRRLGWEIVSEYGFQSARGRTLSRMGASAAYVDPEKLEKGISDLMERASNEMEELRGVSRGRVRGFVLGFLERLKLRGGIFQRELPAEYLESGGLKTWLFHKLNHMPDVGRQSRLPAFLTTQKRAYRFDHIHSAWCERWFDLHFGMDATGSFTRNDDAARFVELLLPSLVRAGILERRQTNQYAIWGLRADALRVSTRVSGLHTARKDGVIVVPEGTEHLWAETPGIQARHTAVYELDPGFHTRNAYYAGLYKLGDVRRVVAEEHTGLLKRQKREEVEGNFKSKDDHPWLPNLLSCTPTLEMGIDIGDLSSAVLCSVPPGQANYLQRIGRAGRKDGNALLLTIANANPHDLYFFAEPAEMFSGRVQPPGVFLNAAAVLERQLLAYAIDRWVERGATKQDLPKKVYDATAEMRQGRKSDHKFPYNLNAFVAANMDDLWTGFRSMFEGSLKEETEAYLRAFLEDSEGGLRRKVMVCLEEQHRVRDALVKQRTSLKRRLSKIRRDVENKKVLLEKDLEEEMEGIGRELKAKEELLKELEQRHLLQLFTDEGLLPNYAFPEEGVTLKSVVWRKKQSKEDSQGKSYESWSYQYARAAGSALTELAPHSRFHAGGRSVTIDQVDMSVSSVESWRFCPSCSYAEREEEGGGEMSCRMCGDDRWSSISQKRDMLRLKQVYANTQDKKSRIHDESDDRQPRFFQKQFLVCCEEKDVTRSWTVKGGAYPFGFEHVRRATFREVNFGELTDRGEALSIAGESKSRTGFAICASCGKVQTHGKDPVHDFACEAKKNPDKARLLDCLYLYREFQGEAVRMVLPFVGQESSRVKQQSFVAALNLGLKVYFGGKVDHLRADLHDEPILDSTQRRQFLVVYDTVPGGTGYLKQLVRPGELKNVLSCALARMVHCSCNQKEDHDGCYRCILAYRNSYEMGATSRKVAVELLQEVLSHMDNLVEGESIGSLSVNPLLESALEAMFLETLPHMKWKAKPLRISNDIVNQKPGYRLEIVCGEEGRKNPVWSIEPQVGLGVADGFSAETRPDFVLWPSRGGRPVAIYLDGWRYHKDRVYKDVRQRAMLARSEQFWTWSLTWEDVESALNQQTHAPVPHWGKNTDKISLYLDKVLEKLPRKHVDPSIIQGGSMEHLVAFLAAPPEERESLWRKVAMGHVAALIRVDQGKGTPAVQSWVDALSQISEPDVARMVDDFGARVVTSVGDGAWSLFVGMRGKSPEDVVCLGWLDDNPESLERRDARRTWNCYLRLLNVLQFLPQTLFVTSRSGEDVPTLSVLTDPPGAEPVEEDPELAEALEECEDAFQRTLLRDVWAIVGPPSLDIGDEMDLPGNEGLPVFAAWEGLRTALLYASEDIDVFEKNSWKAMSIEDLASDESLKERALEWFRAGAEA